MAGIDLSTFPFDWALTFSVLLTHADGTVYRRYGSGDGRDSEAMLSTASLVRTLEFGVADHRAYVASGARRAPPTPRTVEDLPPMKRRLAKGKVSCVHCHTVGDMEREWAEERKAWRRDDAWRHPPAARLGVELDRDDQTLIKQVRPGSPAAVAGLKAGERLLGVAGLSTRTEADVRFALDGLSGEARRVPLAVAAELAAPPRTVEVALADGWRRGDALDLSWRNEMWPLRPNPGFGGPKLGAEEKRKLGLPVDRFAMRINYLIDFGPHPEDGRNAKQAGLKKGDVVFGVDGVADWISERHFQAWWRLTREPRGTAKLDVLSGGVRRTVELPILP
jgi:membrane-associated protease RseP (regulator of RpoE activity)